MRRCRAGVAGYPAAPTTGQIIDGLDRAATLSDVIVFHAGTRQMADGLVVAGGRVLTVVGRGRPSRRRLPRRISAVGLIHFDGMQFRRDIGRKALR